MKKWWNWVLAAALFSFLLVAIPLSLNYEPTDDELKPMFEEYIKNFNKSYQNPEEYQTRFQHFIVSICNIFNKCIFSVFYLFNYIYP